MDILEVMSLFLQKTLNPQHVQAFENVRKAMKTPSRVKYKTFCLR